MPGGDRTGPLGMGPLTGRGAGYCRGNATPGFANRLGDRSWGAGQRVGFGRGGYGRGRRNRFFATGIPGWEWSRGGETPTSPSVNMSGVSRRQEQRYLQEQAELLKSELENINRRLEDLKDDKEA